ncbi:MAG: hypothetical protein FGM18_04705 [Burkholderiaceae bacterium]|nr:hypothetical protein [Burkholderiaceae bacterium]
MEKQQAFNPFDILNTPWGKLPLGNALPGVGSFNFTDLKEMDKRISELKTVEQWLSLNLSMLKTTIQGLEVQRGTLAALQSFTESMTTPAKDKPSTGDGAKAAAGANPFAVPVSFTSGHVTPPAEQANAWWDAIQQQFGQMMVAAQASAQSMMDPQAQTQKKTNPKKSEQKPAEPKTGA